MDVARGLLSTYLFQDLSPAEVEPLLSVVTAKEVPAGQCIFRSGDAAAELWVLLSGQVRVGMLGEDGEEFVFEVVVAPDLIGLPGIVSNASTRVAQCTVTERASVLRIPSVSVKEFMRGHPAVMWRGMQRLSEMARSYSQAQMSLAYQELTVRLARRLVELSDAHGEAVAPGLRIPLKVSQTILAGMVGATREGVNRTLAVFSRQGILFIDGGVVTITDLAALQRQAGWSVNERGAPVHRSG